MSRFFLAALAAATLISAAAAQTIGSGMSDRTRYDGPSYSTIGVRAGDAAACREACRGDLRCYAWNYRRALVSETTAQCELLSHVPTLIWDDEYISGEIGRSQPAPDPDEQVTPRTPSGSSGATPLPPAGAAPAEPIVWDRFTMSEGSEASGTAYSSWTYIGKGDGGLTRCATACAGDSKCQAFVVRSDPELAPRPQVMCELKQAPGALLRNPAATSGVKR